jgi:phage repressor protein C with HTH and peptisase S24 domain
MPTVIKNPITNAAMQMTFGQRVAAAMEKKGLSQGQLAKKLGLKQPTISNILNNPKVTSSKHTMAIARETGVSPDWLESQIGPMVIDEAKPIRARPVPSQETLTTPEINIQQWVKDVPIVGSAACGEDGLFEYNGQILGYARRPPTLIGAPGIFALYIDGESMFPWRRHGDLVLIYPGAPVRIGDYVLAEMQPDSPGAGQKAYIKALVRRTAEKLVLRQYNPSEEKMLPMRRVKNLYRVMDWPDLLGA